ncbi:Cd2+/Zn2+-exporting ATPase [Paenibacillus shirakamiensis]|uniref:Cd(2+)-exporting ATPase n=1 Tax=Paenibacillus shirakamiensis TaxID=1265935 RepID=A0ABS4JM26_9BACL|nr:cation-translocating P-type ATPase [Paenibacillus shirakamiensis]MBP2002762.1 Cd2+/Zn2+-exporting ATPase [Paenibacillus shirakamiensis]
MNKPKDASTPQSKLSTQEQGSTSSSPIEYPVQGLSCSNCARELQDEIRKLDHGQDASLHYNSGRLIVRPEVDMDKVRKILKSDGASLPTLASSASSKASTTKGTHNDTHSHTHTEGGKDHANHDHGEEGHTHEHGDEDNKRILWLLGTAAVLYLSTFLLGDLLSPTVRIIFYIVAIVLSGYSTFWRGLKNLVRLKFNMDTLMTVALAGAVVIGEWKEATLVAILFGLNELLEGYGMSRARKSMESLLTAAPKQAVVIRGDRTETIAIEQLQIGDIVQVRAGEKIPSDGTISEGQSAVNEAAITGESVPVGKKPGDTVFGGSVNADGLLKVKIEKEYKDSSLSKIMHLVQEAQDTKTPTELFIDKFARYYTPAIMIIAALVVLIPPLFFGAPWMKWVYEGLAILIVGCPCALVLSSPIALVSGMTRAARSGILVKGGIHLEQLAKINAIAFDKTGTLTEGRPAVMEEVIYNEDKFYAITGAIEQSSLHPLAQAIVRRAKEKGIQDFVEPKDLNTIAGQGIQAEVGGTTYWVGSEEILNQLTDAESEHSRIQEDLKRLKEAGLTLVLTADRDHVLGIAGLADKIRPESPDVIARLHAAGIQHTVMLTGDHEGTAKAVAAKTGVTDWYAGLLPEQKVDRIKELSSKWNTAMVGDGINDAPALATAQLGIAMGKGTDSAVETADIVLMQDHLGKLPTVIKIARQANRIIKWNIGISLGLKIIALLLTLPGLLTLWIAVMSDMGATIVVTLLGLTILLGKDK